MKKIILINLLVFSLSCKAQNPILDLDDRYTNIQGAYYKDLNNILQPFVGTWKYTSADGTKSFTIKLKKLTMNFNTYNYEDMLVGDYQYTENNVVLLNTLPHFNQITNDYTTYSIMGNILYSKNELAKCDECLPNEVSVSFLLSDDVKDIAYGMYARISYNLDSGSTQPVMKIYYLWTDGFTYPDTGDMFEDFANRVKVEPTIKPGSYELIKK